MGFVRKVVSAPKRFWEWLRRFEIIDNPPRPEGALPPGCEVGSALPPRRRPRLSRRSRRPDSIGKIIGDTAGDLASDGVGALIAKGIGGIVNFFT